jgi:hypothetical protein
MSLAILAQHIRQVVKYTTDQGVTKSLALREIDRARSCTKEAMLICQNPSPEKRRNRLRQTQLN